MATVPTQVRKHVARKFTDEMGRKLKRLKIRVGVHGDFPSDREVCIMEAVTVITGQAAAEGMSDGPVCVSGVLCEAMIALNDEIHSDRQRAKLKRVVPDLIGTAPVYLTTDVVWDETKDDYVEAEVFRTDYENPRYKDAERRRGEAIGKFLRDRSATWEGSEIPLDEKLDLIRKLARIKGAKIKV